VSSSLVSACHRHAGDLTPKQQRFVAEYLIDLNATQAAIRAGYSAKWAEKNAVRLTGNDGIRRAIAEGTRQQLAKVGLTAERTKEAIRRGVDAVALGDIRKMFDARGNVRPITELDEAEAMLIGGFEVVIKNAAAGDGHTDTVLKIRLRDLSTYVEMAAKHFALLTDAVKVDFAQALLDRLDRARLRVAEARKQLERENGQR
jgi:phage terminase small subunit